MEVANKNMEKGTHHQANKFGTSEFGLRVFALFLTLSAAVVLGLDKQTKIVPLQITPDLPPLYVPAIAKYAYVSAYVYFVVANAMACVSATLSLVVACASNRGSGGKSVSRLMIIVADVMILVLLFSSIGAATSVGMIGVKGNSHLRWKKVCHVFGKFCHQVMISVALSFFGGVAILLLVLVSVSKLQKRN